MTVLDIIITYHKGFLAGLWVTLQLAILIWGAGIILGGALGLAASKYKTEVGIPAKIFSFILSGVPILVFLFWLHYPIQAMFNVVINPFITAAVTLGIVNIIAVADLVRTQVDDFPKQYLTAAKVCGLSPTKTVRYIQFPIIFRQILPGLMLLQVTMLHTTLFASLISVEEIFRVAQRINSSIYKPVEIYTALGVFFLLICLPINGLALFLRAKFTRNLSEN